MLQVGDGKLDALAARIRACFEQGSVDLEDEAKRIVAKGSADKTLKDGSTVRQMMRSAETISLRVAEEALDAFERSCAHALVSRRRLKTVTRTEVASGVSKLSEQARDRLWRLGFEGSVLFAADGLGDQAKTKALGVLDARFDGWTGQAATFARRHPGWTALGTYLVGVLTAPLTDLIKWAVGKFLGHTG